jgi:hypothetical protein
MHAVSESSPMGDVRNRKATGAVLRGAALAVLFCIGGLAVSPSCRAAGDPGQSPAAASPQGGSDLVYDREYPFIGYSGTPMHNDIAHLQARIRSGQVKLQYRAPRGYLDSLLAALKIDPSSQSLVFSKTSLQADRISPQTPRAIYFNDDTYVAWIAGTSMIEITTMDSVMGTVFYTVSEQPDAPAHFERETTRCLNCHDTFSLGGGGVPNFLFLSAYTRRQREIVTNEVANPNTDATPLADRWGGWYVTGDLGGLATLGNILPSPTGSLPLAASHPQSVARLDSFFDTSPYLTDKSDVVALLVLQHQVSIHNLIIHANYKSRMLMERTSPGSSTQPIKWDQLSTLMQTRFKALLEPLVRGMLFVNAAKFPTHIRGDSAFAESFEARGPRDSLGRSLRDFDLNTRLFKYPLSFLIYSEGFDYLPLPARQYVYHRLAEILTGRDTSPTFSNLSAADREAILEILRATKPEFARSLGQATTNLTASAE